MHSALPFYVPSSFRHSRAGFEQIPQNLTRPELFRYFTFSEEDCHEILQCRGDHKRIGFALLLGGKRSKAVTSMSRTAARSNPWRPTWCVVNSGKKHVSSSVTTLSCPST